MYRKHTMYPGGLKEIKYKDMMKRKPDEVRSAVSCEAEVPGVHRISHPFIDHSPGGVWDVAQKQVTGEEVREAPYFP